MHTLRHNPPWGKARDQPTDPRFTHTRQPYQEHAGHFPADTGISPSCSQERWPEDREHQRRRHGAAATAEPAQRNSDDPDPALPAVGQRPAGCQPQSPRLDQGRPCPCTRRYASPLHGKSNAFAGTGSSRTGPACPCAVRTSGSTEDAVRACHPPWLRPPQNQHSPSPALPYIHVAPPAPPPGPRSALLCPTAGRVVWGTALPAEPLFGWGGRGDTYWGWGSICWGHEPLTRCSDEKVSVHQVPFGTEGGPA